MRSAEGNSSVNEHSAKSNRLRVSIIVCYLFVFRFVHTSAGTDQSLDRISQFLPVYGRAWIRMFVIIPREND